MTYAGTQACITLQVDGLRGGMPGSECDFGPRARGDCFNKGKICWLSSDALAKC
jgi:hypothetical protein